MYIWMNGTSEMPVHARLKTLFVIVMKKQLFAILILVIFLFLIEKNVVGLNYDNDEFNDISTTSLSIETQNYDPETQELLEICSQKTIYKDLCYVMVADMQGEPSVCNILNYKDAIEECKKAVQNNIGIKYFLNSVNRWTKGKIGLKEIRIK